MTIFGGAGRRASDITKREAREEWQKREAQARQKRAALFSFLAVADGHVKQLALMNDRARRILALCSRRAGKTFAMATILLATAREIPGSNSIYFGLTRGSAKKTMWTEIWVPLCQKWGIECSHNIAELTTTFPNGSHVYFAGTDDERHIETNLGFKLTLAICDEAQSQSRAILERLIKVILPPALSDLRGRLIVAGTIPESPAGYFWDLWSDSEWSKHNWSRFDNPHMGSVEVQREELEEFKRSVHLSEDDPLIQRDWHGLTVFDATALAFRYLESLNGFAIGSEARDPLGKWVTRVAPDEVVKLCDFFSVGGDQGGKDRNIVQVNGWSTKHRDVYQVFEWAAIKNHGGAWSSFGPALDEIRKRFGEGAINRPYFDFGGSTLTMDNFTTDFGVYALHAAKKADRKGQVDRLNNLLMTGRYHCMIGSDLVSDFVKTQWDKNHRDRGRWEWSGHNHPDAGDANRYSLQGFFDAYVEPEEPETDEDKGFDDGDEQKEWFERDLGELLPDGPSELLS